MRRPTDRRPPTTVPRERTAHDVELLDEMDEFLRAIDAVLETPPAR